MPEGPNSSQARQPYGRRPALAGGTVGLVNSSGVAEGYAGQVTARRHVELAKHLAEVVVHGAGADKQLRGDLRVGRTPGRQRRDLHLLGREVVAGFRASLAGGLPGCDQLSPGPLGETGRADVIEVRIGSSQVLPGLGAALAAP